MFEIPPDADFAKFTRSIFIAATHKQLCVAAGEHAVNSRSLFPGAAEHEVDSTLFGLEIGSKGGFGRQGSCPALTVPARWRASRRLLILP